MISKSIAQKALAAALTSGGDFAELFLEDKLSHNIHMKQGIVESSQRARTHGAGIRVYNDLDSVYVYTNDTSEKGLIACGQRAAAAIKEGRRDILNPKDLHFHIYNSRHPILKHPENIGGLDKVEKMRAAHRGTRISDQISQVVINYMDYAQKIAIFNSEGLAVEDERVRTRLVCSAIASNGDENQTGFSDMGAAKGFELFENGEDPIAMGKEAAEIALRMLHAPSCPAGVMPVVIDGGFGGVIFHEACGHSLEATSVAHNLSEFSGKIGEKIAADCVTAIDDGSLPNVWGSANIDDEGTPTRKIVLIEKGILKSYMVDRFNGRRMNMPSTGSGRRESYAYAPTSRMHNTYIAAGEDEESSIISTMGDGLYAKRMGGGSVNPTTGEFNFNVAEGYLVKDGKIAHPVREASLIGKGSQVLLDIDRVGKNMFMSQGNCGSISGMVPANVGQPMIRVKALTVGGK